MSSLTWIWWLHVIEAINFDAQVATFQGYPSDLPVRIHPGIYQIVLTKDLGVIHQVFLVIQGESLALQQQIPKLAWELIYLNDEDKESSHFVLRSTLNPENIEPYYHQPKYIVLNNVHKFVLDERASQATRFSAFFSTNGHLDGKVLLRTTDGYYLSRELYDVVPKQYFKSKIWQIKHAFPYIPGVEPPFHHYY